MEFVRTGPELGENLRMYRLMNGFTQNEVADYIGVERSTYTYYETGKTLPNIFTVILLSELYGVTIEDLVRLFP